MKEIEILSEQIKKLDDKSFDLDVWKLHTTIILSRIFGDNSDKIRQIENIQYDFSSWTLRDTTGNTSNLETCKKMGKELLQASIDELRTFGLPDLKSPVNDVIPASVLSGALEDELKLSQLRDLKKIVNADLNREEKTKLIKDLFKEMRDESYVNIVLAIFANPLVTGKL
jgi:hypothetical protein